MADAGQPANRFHSVRSVAAKILHGVLRGGSLTKLLQDQANTVAEADRPLLAEMTYGSCRWYHQLDAITALLLQKPLRKRDKDIHALIVIGLYQLNFMRVKPHAVLTETVNAARHLGKPVFTRLVNGVLRRFQREQQQLLEQIKQADETLYSMPAWLLNEVKTAWPRQWQQIAQAMLKQPPLTLRLNTQRVTVEDYLQKLVQAKLSARPVNGLPAALILDKAVPVEKIPEFDQGYVSVQDAGAQLAAILLDAKPGSIVLDACSAPGGKTGHILETGSDLDMTAIDVDSQRLQKVAGNLQRLGLKARLEVADAASAEGRWASQQYDYILLDVPCSATGVIRRHPDIKLLRRSDDINDLVHLQRKILSNIWPMLKKGGRLLYATCSLLPAENESQVDWFLQQQQDAVELSIKTQVEHQRRQHGIQLLPDVTTDGFYYSLLEKI